MPTVVRQLSSNAPWISLPTSVTRFGFWRGRLSLPWRDRDACPGHRRQHDDLCVRSISPDAPLPYTNPDELVMVWEDGSRFGFPRNTPAPGNYNDWRCAIARLSTWPRTRRDEREPDRRWCPRADNGPGRDRQLFWVLGMTPALGRRSTVGTTKTTDRHHQRRARATPLPKRSCIIGRST